MDQQPKMLHHEHTREAIAARLQSQTAHSYLGDFVLGAIDGAITTFAIVCGVAGAGMSAGVAIVLGFANVLADGFSMAVSNYLKTKSEHEFLDRARWIEEGHIDRYPEGEREEVRQIYASKGFSGELLEEITRTITLDRRRWVDTMLTEELGLQLKPPKPVRAGLVTFAAFLLAGVIPLTPLFFHNQLSDTGTFAASAAATGVTFAAIGYFKGRVLYQPLLWSIFETMAIGGCAAALAYFAGDLLKGWFL